MAEKVEDHSTADAERAERNAGVLEQMEAAAPRGSAADSEEKVAEKPAEQTSPEQKPSKLKQLWQKVGLDPLTLMLMFKGSVPPTVAIAMYQSTAIQAKYSTLGYLVAIR